MTFWLAALAGLLGSGHCIGMCGGLVSGCFLRLGLGARRPAPQAAYHAARMGVYAAVGGMAGGLGEALTQSGGFGLAQGLLQVAAGIVVIFLGLDVLGLSPLHLTFGFAPAAWTRALFSRAVGPTSGTPPFPSSPPPPVAGPAPLSLQPLSPWRGAFLAGLANGLMPCALTLSIAVQAATTGSAAAGALLMAAFGAGTLPSMVAVGLLFARLTTTARATLLKGAAVLIVLMGVRQIVQGLAYTRVMGKIAL